MNSVTGPVDVAVKLMLYEKFADILGINDGEGTNLEKINLGIIQYPRDTAVRAVSEKRGQDYLEFISFWRENTSLSWNRQRTVLARRGLWLPSVSGTSGINIKAQPVDLNYNVWFWSKSLDKVYQCIERYILWQHSYPKIDLVYNYGNNEFSYSPDLHFGEPVDESTFSTEYNTGVIVVYRVPIKIDAWVLDSGSVLNNGIITKIMVTFYDGDSITGYSEIINDETSNYDSDLSNTLRISRKQIYRISEVSTSDNSVIIPNNRIDDFKIGDIVTIEDSTFNDNTYTVSSVSLIGNFTKIILGTNLIISDVADGLLCVTSS